jgi:hypothetical protein
VVGAPGLAQPACNGVEMASEWQRRAAPAPPGSPVHPTAAVAEAARVDGWRASSEERSGGHVRTSGRMLRTRRKSKEWQRRNVLVAPRAGHGISRHSRRFGSVAARKRVRAYLGLITDTSFFTATMLKPWFCSPFVFS